MRTAILGMLTLLADSMLTNALGAVLFKILNSGSNLGYLPYIFGIRSIVQMLHSLFLIPIFVRKFGPRSAFLAGILILCISSMLTAWKSDPYYLLFAQFVHGIGASFVFTCGVLLVVTAYPNPHRGKMTGILYSGLAWGTIVGSLGGGFVFKQFGQMTTFFGLAVIIFAVFVSCLILLPIQSDVVDSPLVPSNNSLRVVSSSSSPMLILRILRSPAIILSVLCIICNTSSLGSLLALVPEYLGVDCGLDPSAVGASYVPAALSYIFLSYIAANYLSKKLQGQKIAICGLFIHAMSFLALSCFYDKKSWKYTVPFFSLGFASASFIDVTQPGVIAAFVEQQQKYQLSYVTGAVIGDVCGSSGFSLVLLLGFLKAYFSKPQLFLGFAVWLFSVSCFVLFYLEKRIIQQKRVSRRNEIEDEKREIEQRETQVVVV